MPKQRKCNLTDTSIDFIFTTSVKRHKGSDISQAYVMETQSPQNQWASYIVQSKTGEKCVLKKGQFKIWKVNQDLDLSIYSLFAVLDNTTFCSVK